MHQGVATSVPEGAQAGRGIWMRDDLRPEMFAGIGGAREPDLRVYDASIAPGDSLVLASSDLARMLSEEDVRQAVTYEEAATGAERLKQLALQRGVEAGVALVIEIAASLAAPSDAPPDSDRVGPARSGLHMEMPPIGSIFSTARQRLLDAIEHGSAPVPGPAADDEPLWPKRPLRGAWKTAPLEARAVPLRPTKSDAAAAAEPAPLSTGLFPKRTATAASQQAQPMAETEASGLGSSLSSVARGLGARVRGAVTGVAQLAIRDDAPSPSKPLTRQERMARFGFGARSSAATAEPMTAEAERPGRLGFGSRGYAAHAATNRVGLTARHTAARAGGKVAGVEDELSAGDRFDFSNAETSGTAARREGFSSSARPAGRLGFATAAGDPSAQSHAARATALRGRSALARGAGAASVLRGATERLSGLGARLGAASAGTRQRATVGRAMQNLPGSAARTASGLAASTAAAIKRLRAGEGGARRFVAPVLGALIALLLVLMGVRAVKAQQAKQLQQRFDSLITASGQLEAQARASGDKNESQSLIHRAQALVDQANTLEPNQSRVATLRKDLQGDLDRLDNILALPDPVVLANLATVGKDMNAVQLGGSSAGLFVVDAGGHRLIQIAPGQKIASGVATKGDKNGPNQLADPKLVSVVDGQALLLDSNRNLWRYDPTKKSLEQIGLKSSDTWKDATAMAGYGPNVYVLDATVGNIYRYASRGGQFTDAPTRFLAKDDTDLLGKATSLAIDGSFWALTSDGQVLKLEGGARVPFSISGLPQPIGKAAQLYTDAGVSSLYVLDVANSRVV
ncbi:MAG TPA: hypothetical protein VFS62_05600, partial [Chloroflexota bacterium]|nr:hypothetical protein [Chloroflexota bacterium]